MRTHPKLLLAALPLAAFSLAAAPADTPTAADGGATTTEEETLVDQHDGSSDGDSSASATAADIAGIVTLGETSADTEGDGSASAHAVKIGGESISGADQEGAGESEGELFGTGETELGELSVAPYETSVDEDRSHGSAAVARVTVIDEDTLYIEVLSSESTATSDGSEAQTTGVTVDLDDGSLFLRLLHAQTASNGEGSSALAIINGQGIFTSEQVDGQCEIPADPLAHLLCLYADAEAGDAAGDGEGPGDAGVLDATLADGNLHGDLFQASADPAADDDTAVMSEELAAEDDPAPAPSGALPMTGGGLGLLTLGLGLLGAGGALQRVRRRA